ncbi:MAG: serine/threonine-protein kinase [Gemmatimonadaceae bacterium]
MNRANRAIPLARRFPYDGGARVFFIPETLDVSELYSNSPEGYEIRRELGRGATAVVYLAYDEKHDRLVALKHLQSDLLLTPTRFLGEIHTIAGMQHPHILPLHDSGVWDDAPFFVMPYVNGETLEQRIRREGALPIADAVAIAEEVGDALEYAHRNGVIHRDIKPANILLADGHAYVADFGIAHVISLASEMRVTGTGIAVGTPAYMSPEQAAGMSEVDGRSDLYSLGCVLFEMLTGHPPFPGKTPRAVIVRRASGPPDAMRTVRPKVPDSLERVVVRLLAEDPGDRFATAGEFVRELTVVEPDVEPREPRTSRTRAVLIAAGILALAAAGVVYARGAGGDAAVDQYTYAVFPFRHVGTAQNSWLNGDGCARLLHDAMARWQGVRLVDDMRVSDVWNRQQPRTVADAFAAAKSLRAGQLAWGEVVTVGDSLEIRVVAYDVLRASQPTRQFVVRLSRDTPQIERVFTALADSIILGGRRVREGAATGTRNLIALEKFLDGRAAIDRFDLRLAEQSFKEALATDESYAHAHFWLARTMAWEGEAEPSAWTSNAARAVALSATLSPRDRAHAGALLDLAEGRMAEACQRYRTLIDTDSLDFSAWFGLGDCNARDAIVVRDAKSASGYSFRGSTQTAITSYRRALTLVPSFHIAERGVAFARLSRRVLFTEESRLRRGVAVAPDTQRFAAFPSFAANTLAFTPRPYAQAIAPSARPATERQAVLWGAETYRQLTADWVRAFPASGDAQENHALALEAANGIAGSGAGMPAALTAARNSLRGTVPPSDRTRREVLLVRLLLKADSVAAARAVADSALREWSSPTPYQAGYLAGIAALTGRAARAAALSARAASDSESVPFVAANGKRATLPSEVTSGALQLQAYAALGGPRDSLRATLARTSRSINAWIPAAEQAEARQMLFRNTFGLAYDQLAPLASFTVAPDRDQRLAMRIAVAKHDTASAHRFSRAMIARAAEFSPGTMGVDNFYHHAMMLLALGDTATATAQLDAGLAGMPRARISLVTNMAVAASIAPAMALRSDLAWQARDFATFDKWARPAVILWSDADPELRRRIDVLRSRQGTRQP